MNNKTKKYIIIGVCVLLVVGGLLLIFLTNKPIKDTYEKENIIIAPEDKIKKQDTQESELDIRFKEHMQELQKKQRDEYTNELIEDLSKITKIKGSQLVDIYKKITQVTNDYTFYCNNKEITTKFVAKEIGDKYEELKVNIYNDSKRIVFTPINNDKDNAQNNTQTKEKEEKTKKVVEEGKYPVVENTRLSKQQLLNIIWSNPKTIFKFLSKEIFDEDDIDFVIKKKHWEGKINSYILQKITYGYFIKECEDQPELK